MATTNRLAIYVAEHPTLKKPKEPGPGDLCYAMALWRAYKASKWCPFTLDAIPPMMSGRFTVIWTPHFELARVLEEIASHNSSALDAAPKHRNRVKSWAVPVRMIFDRDETARIVDAKGGGI